MEVAVQVSPRDPDCLSAPLQGIIPKQENITGKDETESRTDDGRALKESERSRTASSSASLFQLAAARHVFRRPLPRSGAAGPPEEQPVRRVEELFAE